MSITMKELPDMVGRFLLVEVASPDADGETREVRGKCTAVSGDGIVLQFRGSAELISLDIVVDIELDEKLHRSSLRPTSILTVRQHLLDKHGRRLDFVKSYPIEELLVWHEKQNHEPLGHLHQDPPLRERGIPEPIVKIFQVVPRSSVRQHLLDWHGMPFELIKGIDLEVAVMTHNQAAHGILGHVHKPQ